MKGVKYLDGNKATVTDSHRALIIQYDNETFEDSLTNIKTLESMEIDRYPDVDRIEEAIEELQEYGLMEVIKYKGIKYYRTLEPQSKDTTPKKMPFNVLNI